MTEKDAKIRTITTDDAPKLLDYFRKLVEVDQERVERPEDVSRITLVRERQWISGKLKSEEDGDMIIRCVEVSGQIISLGEVERLKRWIERHVAEIRFGLLPDSKIFGMALVQELEQQAVSLGVEILVYFHLETQEQGLSIMRESGFGEIGRIPRYYKRQGGYVDRLYLAKHLK